MSHDPRKLPFFLRPLSRAPALACFSWIASSPPESCPLQGKCFPSACMEQKQKSSQGETTESLVSTAGSCKNQKDLVSMSIFPRHKQGSCSNQVLKWWIQTLEAPTTTSAPLLGIQSLFGHPSFGDTFPRACSPSNTKEETPLRWSRHTNGFQSTACHLTFLLRNKEEL